MSATLENDPRPIEGLYVNSETEQDWVGIVTTAWANITAIKPFVEPSGHMWFLVYKGKTLSYRVQSAPGMIVSYEEP
jgi:hypothetical protein